jgi:hypothetical protein
MNSTTNKSRILLGAAVLAASLTGCNLFEESGSGTVRGRVVGANGQPLSGARVTLDRVGGRTTVSNMRGEFRIGGARDGGHTVLAYSVAQDAAGSAHANVGDGEVVDVGDVLLMDCDDVVANSPNGGMEDDGSVSSDGNGDPTVVPCVMEPPPPPAANITIASLSGDYASGYIDPWGVYGYADDSSKMAGFDFWISADLTAGGAFADHVVNDYANGLVEAHVGLFTYGDDSGWGYYYVLREGDVTVSVTDDGDGDPSTLQFSFSGTNLVFDYAGWEGIDSTHTANVASAAAAGTAWQYIPPEPPTADITLTTFVADWKYISLCPACGADGGDVLYTYAYDETNQADLSLYVPVSALNLGGAAELAGNWETEVYGWASVYSDGNGWGYDLDHLTATAGASLVSGQLFSLTLSGAQFNYIDAYGGGVVVMEGEEGAPDGSNGGGGDVPPPEPTVSELQLFIGSADLSAIVDEYFCGDPGTGEPGEPGGPDRGGLHGDSDYGL